MNSTALAVAGLLTGAALSAQHAIVPGVERLRSDAASTAAERGAILLRELGCTACHASDAGHLAPRPAPDLRSIGARVTTSWLRRFLTDPQAVKPGSTMPGCVPAATREGDVDLLVHYLASRGGPLRPATVVFDTQLVGEGRELFQTIGCAACHQPAGGGKTATASVPLGALAHKTTVDALQAFLRDPHAVRPAGRMPRMWLTDGEARALAMYLLRDQADNPQADRVQPPPRAGLLYEYAEVETNQLPDFELLEFKRRGQVPEVRIPGGTRKQRFALRLRGDLDIPEDGAFVFRVRADDGARLLIDGYEVVADDPGSGRMDCTGQVELRKGKHRFEVQYFQHRGGQNLQVSWTRPDQRDRRIPANRFSNRLGRAMVPLDSPPAEGRVGRDAAKVQRGAALFQSLRCAACHEPGVETAPARPLADLDPQAKGGCLAAEPSGAAVAYALSADQRDELRAALGDPALAKAPPAARQVRHAMAAFNCYACHQRDGVGGVEEDRYALFTTKVPIDLGDEGKLPPPLTGVGYKLRPAAIEDLLVDGKHRIRERFIATRMPGYPAALAGDLTRQLVAADRKAAAGAPPEFATAAVHAGRRIVGTNGFGCVTCHNVNGDRAAGIQGVDLAAASQRLNPHWFREYLRAPNKFRPDTRMPAFWGGVEKSPLADVLDGTTASQIDAVWSYLSLGKSIPAPAGVQRPDGSPQAELIPRERPIVHRTFMKDVGPRTIVAGFPQRLHVAFDAQAVRMAKVWRGRFFDSSGVASGRSGSFLGPLGDQVLDLPAPGFARLPRADAAWPVIGARARDVGGDFLGLRLDPAGAPTFRYRLAGVTIDEQPVPRLQPGGAALRRLFRLEPGAKAPVDFYFRAWHGTAIEPAGQGRWRSGPVTITLQTDPRDAVRIRAVEGGAELVIQFVFRGEPIRFEEEIQW